MSGQGNRLDQETLQDPMVLQVPALGFGHMLVGLFLFPHVALVSARLSGDWRRALLMIVLVGTVAGGCLSAVWFPGAFRATEEWAAWLGKTVGAFWVEESGDLRWEYPDALPFETRHGGWKVEFMDAAAGTKFVPEKITGPEQRGVWLSSAQVMVWWMNADGEVTYWRILDSLDEKPRSTRSLMWLDGSEFASFATSMMRMLWPLMVLGLITGLIGTVLFYTLLFTATSLLLRSPAVTGGLRSALAVNLSAGVPPMIVAAVYSGLNLPFLDFHRVFIMGFFIYLIMALSRIRIQAQNMDQS